MEGRIAVVPVFRVFPQRIVPTALWTRLDFEIIERGPIPSPEPGAGRAPLATGPRSAMPKLTEPDILSRMPAAREWERLGDMLVRSWQFPSSRRSLEFVNQVAALAERRGHHPDIILSYRTVRLELSTHAVGGLTEDDFAFAAEVNTLPVDR